jgi:hypothetical protein
VSEWWDSLKFAEPQSEPAPSWWNDLQFDEQDEVQRERFAKRFGEDNPALSGPRSSYETTRPFQGTSESQNPELLESPYMRPFASARDALGRELPEPVDPSSPEELAALSYFRSNTDRQGLDDEPIDTGWLSGTAKGRMATARELSSGLWKGAADALEAVNKGYAKMFGEEGQALADATNWLDKMGSDVQIRAAYDRMIEAESTPENALLRTVSSGVRAIPDMALVIGTTALTRNPNAGYAAMGGQVFSQEYGRSRYLHQNDIDTALMDATAATAWELGPERAFRVLEPIAKGLPIGKMLGQVALAEGLSEGTTEGLTMFDDWARKGEDAPGLVEGLARAAEAAGTGVVMGLGMAGGGSAIQSVDNKIALGKFQGDFNAYLQQKAHHDANRALDPNRSPVALLDDPSPSGGMSEAFDAGFKAVDDALGQERAEVGQLGAELESVFGQEAPISLLSDIAPPAQVATPPLNNVEPMVEQPESGVQFQQQAAPEQAAAPEVEVRAPVTGREQLPKVKNEQGEWVAGDPRLMRQEYRDGLTQLTTELVKGGGIALVQQGGPRRADGSLKQDYEDVVRTPSENPAWFQGLSANTGISTVGVKRAVQAALEGRKLGVRQAEVVDTMLEIVRDARTGVDPRFGPEFDSWRDMLGKYRTMRAEERAPVVEAEFGNLDGWETELADEATERYAQAYEEYANDFTPETGKADSGEGAEGLPRGQVPEYAAQAGASEAEAGPEAASQQVAPATGKKDYTNELREDLGVSQDLIDSYVPENAVEKLGRDWYYTTIDGADVPHEFKTKKAAIAAAEKHKALKQDQFENPASYRNIYSVRARKRLALIRKYMDQGMTEMEAGAKARAEIPEVGKSQAPVAPVQPAEGQQATPIQEKAETPAASTAATTAPEIQAESAPEQAQPQETAPEGKTEDFGEKIGGAPKDTAEPAAQRSTAAGDERTGPALSVERIQAIVDEHKAPRASKFKVVESRAEVPESGNLEPLSTVFQGELEAYRKRREWMLRNQPESERKERKGDQRGEVITDVPFGKQKGDTIEGDEVRYDRIEGTSPGRGDDTLQGELFLSNETPSPAPDKPYVKVVQTGTVHTGLTSATTPSEIAHIAAPLRKEAQESLIAVVTGDAGKVLAVARHTIGAIDSAFVYPGVVGGVITSIPGARHVWFVHNHPSGKTKQSAADIQITNKMHDLLRGSGVEPMGMLVVTTGGKASYFRPEDPGGGASTDIDIQPAARRQQVPLVERRMRGRDPTDRSSAIQGSGDARAVMREMAGERPGVLLLNAGHNPLKFIEMSEQEMASLRTGDPSSGVGRLLKEAGGVNASNAVINFPHGESFDRGNLSPAHNLAKALNASQIRVLDILLKGYESHQVSNGMIPSGEDFKSTREPGLGAGVEGLYDPDGDTIYLFADQFRDENRVRWVSWHELWHRGARVAYGDALDSALGEARSNPVVRRLANAIYRDRDMAADVADGRFTEDRARLIAAEEALAELDAARLTGDFEHIRERYKVRVPGGLKSGWRKVVADFFDALRRVLGRVLGRDASGMTDQQVREVIQRGSEASGGAMGEVQGAAMASEAQGGLLDEPTSQEQLKDRQRRIDERLTGKDRELVDVDEGPGGLFGEDPTTKGQQPLLSKAPGLDFNPDFSNWTLPTMRLAEAMKDESLTLMDKALDGTANLRLDARQWLQDKMIPVRRIQEAVEKSGATISEFANVYEKEQLMSGRVEDRFKQMQDQDLHPLTVLMNKHGVNREQLGEYLYARHAEARNERIASINEKLPDGGSGMTNAEAQKVLKQFEADGLTKPLQEMAAIVDRITTKTRENFREYGLLDPMVLDSWEQDTAFNNTYVPLRGFADALQEEFGRPGKGFDIRGDETKRALGRRSKAGDIIGHVLSAYKLSVIRGEKNRVGQSLLRLALDNPNPNLWEINPVGMKTVLDPKTGMTTEVLDLNLSDPNMFFTKVDGKAWRIELKDKRLSVAMKNLGADNMKPLVQALSLTTRYLSLTRTMLSPEFVITNFMRDAQTAAINLSGEQGSAIARAALNRKSITHSMRAMFNEQRSGKKGDPEWRRYAREYTEDGGRVAFFRAESVEELARKLDRLQWAAGPSKAAAGFRGLKAGYEFIEDMNLAVENAVRLAAYKAAREHGVSRQKAAVLAKNLTVNFNRKGTAGPGINAFYMFANASIQGVQRTLQAAKNPRVQKILLSSALFGTLMTILNELAGGEDDDGESFYSKIPDSDKGRKLIFMIPQAVVEQVGDLPGMSFVDSERKRGAYLTIHLPYGYSVPYVMGEIMGSTMFGVEPSEAATRMISAINNSFNPLGGSDLFSTFSPTLVDPFAEVARNKNWYGGQVHPQENPFDNTPAPKSGQGWSSTAGPYKWVAGKMNEWSGGTDVQPGWFDYHPETYRHFLEFAVGGTGSFFERVGDNVHAAISPEREVDVNRIPFMRQFFGTTRDFADRDRYYRNIQGLEYLAKEDEDRYNKVTDGEMRKDRYEEWFNDREEVFDSGLIGEAKGTEKVLRKVRKELKDAKQHGAPANEVKELEDEILRIQREFNTEYNKVMLDRGWLRSVIEKRGKDKDQE